MSLLHSYNFFYKNNLSIDSDQQQLSESFLSTLCAYLDGFPEQTLYSLHKNSVKFKCLSV